MARRIGEPSTLAYGLHGYLSSHLSPDSALEQAELVQELIRVALQAGDIERAVEGHEIQFEYAVELADMSAVYANLEAMTRLAEDLRQPAQTWLVGVYSTLVALLEGRFDEAERLLAETRSVGERALRWSAAVSHGLQLYLLRREQGRLDEVEQLVRRSATDNPTYPIWRCVLATMLTELGSTEEARRELDALAARDFGGIPFDEEWEVSLCLLAETAARLGETAAAATLYRLLLPYADRVSISYPEISLGPVARLLGVLASTTGSYDDAAGHFEDALAMCKRINARPWLAHAQDDFAHMLLARGEPGDAEKAESLLESARTAYRQLGMRASPSPTVLASPSMGRGSRL